MSGRLTAAHVMSAAALFLAIGGGAYALASTSSTITVCVHKQGGGLYKAASCASGDSKLSWNQVGPRGPRGLPGRNGTTIAARARGAGPSATSNSFTASTLTHNTWTQAPTEFDTIVAQATIQEPSATDCGSNVGGVPFPGFLSGNLLVDGNIVSQIAAVAASGNTVTMTFPLAYLFEPGAPTTHSVTTQFEDDCGEGGNTANARFDVTNVAIDVEAAR